MTTWPRRRGFAEYFLRNYWANVLLKQSLKEVGPYIDLGMRLALTILFGLVLGYFLDKKVGLLPLFTLVGAILGMVGGMLSIYRSVYGRKEDKSKSEH